MAKARTRMSEGVVGALVICCFLVFLVGIILLGIFAVTETKKEIRDQSKTLPGHRVDLSVGSQVTRSEPVKYKKFLVHGDGTVTDPVGGLMWQEGDSRKSMSLDDGIRYCATLSVGGYSDWQLPTTHQLIGLYQAFGFSDSGDKEYSPFEWSGTRYLAADVTFGFGSAVDFRDGHAIGTGPTAIGDSRFDFVRAVRQASSRRTATASAPSIPRTDPARVSAVAQNRIVGSIYSNEFVGLTIPVPADWYVATDNEVKGLMPDAARVMGLDDPVVRSIVAQMPGKVLLVISERPFSTDDQAVSRNILIAAISARDMKDEISSGSDYLDHVARGMRDSQLTATVSDITTQRLGGEEFHRLPVTLVMQGTTVHMSQFARIHNDYLLILNMTAASEGGLQGLVEVADGMRLPSVSPTVDGSAEGEAFRKQAALKIPQSSGNTLLKNAGLVLMILGGLWFLRALFSKK